MKKMKKILAFVMAMAMVLGMSVTSFAAGLKDTVPSDQDDGKITITGLKENDVVTIYKIVKASYGEDDKGFTGYESVHYTVKDGKTVPMIAKTDQPKAEEIAALLAHIKGTDTDHSKCDKDDKAFTQSKTVGKGETNVEFEGLKIGTYLVDVTAGNGSTTVYNPMVASVYYVVRNDQNSIEDGSVGANTNWNINGDIVYAKSSNDNDITKTIVGSDRKSDDKGYGKGDDVAAGTAVSFAIEGTIPSYDKEFYSNPTYVITDELSDGLDFLTVEADAEKGIEEKTAQQLLQEKADEIFGADNSEVLVTGRIFTLTLKPKYLFDIAGKVANNETPDDAAKNDRTFRFEYKAVLNGSAYNFDASTNKAHVTYSNKPATDNDAGTVTPPDKKTYHYTFSIGALLTQTATISEKTTNIIQKIDSATGEILSTDETVVESSDKFTKIAEGAVFELKNKVTNAIYEATTDKNGQLKFEGLDAGEYTLKETKAPTGYTLSEIEYPVVITPEYRDDGQLSKLTIKIGEEVTITYTAEYTPEGALSNIKLPDEVVANEEKFITKIPNTKLSSLPSTGGIGTTIFTIGGCAIMIIAAGLYFASRRKSAK